MAVKMLPIRKLIASQGFKFFPIQTRYQATMVAA